MKKKIFSIWLILIVLTFPRPAPGREPIRITADEYEKSMPRWSPDAEQISFIANKHGRLILALFSLRLKAQTVLCDDVSTKGAYSWSPDGKYIAYTAKDNGRPSVNIVEVVSQKKERIHEGKNPTFSPNGRQLAFATDKNILIYHLELKKITPLTDEKETAIFGNLAWTPAGESIYYCKNGDLWSISSNGRDKKCVLNHTNLGSPPPFIDNPAISPTDHEIYFSLITEGLWSHPTNNILARYEPKTGKTVQLFEANSWSLSHSGKYIGYSLGKEIMIFNTVSQKSINFCEGFEPSFSQKESAIVYSKQDKTANEIAIWFLDLKEPLRIDIFRRLNPGCCILRHYRQKEGY